MTRPATRKIKTGTLKPASLASSLREDQKQLKDTCEQQQQVNYTTINNRGGARS